MTMENLLFWDYAVIENGQLVGIQKDSPKEVVESYEQYLKEVEEAKRQGIKL